MKIRFNRICAIGTCTFAIACSTSIPAQADTIRVTYSFAGHTLGAPVITGTTLTVDGVATGSVLSGNAALNTAWNPVTFNTHNAVDITNGLK